MESLQLKPWGKKFFENIESEAPISLILYREDDCEIYELPDNRIIKLSSSNEGYNTVHSYVVSKTRILLTSTNMVVLNVQITLMMMKN